MSPAEARTRSSDCTHVPRPVAACTPPGHTGASSAETLARTTCHADNLVLVTRTTCCLWQPSEQWFRRLYTISLSRYLDIPTTKKMKMLDMKRKNHWIYVLFWLEIKMKVVYVITTFCMQWYSKLVANWFPLTTAHSLLRPGGGAASFRAINYDSQSQNANLLQPRQCYSVFTASQFSWLFKQNAAFLFVIQARRSERVDLMCRYAECQGTLGYVWASNKLLLSLSVDIRKD